MVVSEIPTPYRLPLFARLAKRPELDLEVAFCAEAEYDRPWEIEDLLRDVPHRILAGFAPGVRTRRNAFVYEVNPGIVRLLARGRYDALVVGGYSVFAEQAAIAYARLRRVPYLLHNESHDLSPRAGWKRSLKRVLLPPLVSHAAAGLAVGSAAARYLASYGLDPGRIRIVPNTIDVAGYGKRAAEARARATEIRRELDLPERYLVFAGRLVEAKGLPHLVEALRLLGPAAPLVIVAGEGPLAAELASVPGLRLVGFQQQDRLIQLLALADAALVPSRREPWGVVVNEALACGCPVIASDVVGAAVDLIIDGVNGRVVPAGDARALAAAIASGPPSGDPAQGTIKRWTYDFAVEQFLEALSIALRR